MRYRKPFTLDQRQDAIALYRSWRAMIGRIRFEFRPRTEDEWECSSDRREAVNQFGHVLKSKDAKLDVARLNALFQRATDLGAHYAYLRNRKSSEREDV